MRGRPSPLAHPAPRELFEEPHVALEEQSEIRYAEPGHGDALDPEAEREPREALGVVSDVLEHLRMDHPAPQQLDPPGPAARATPRAATHETRHCQLRSR